MIRVFITDDHTIVREGLCRLIGESPDVTVAGEAGTGEETIWRAATERWDVLLLDLNLPDLSGLEVLRRVRELHPRLPVLVLTMQAEDAYALRVLNAGASGFLGKGRPSTTVLEAIRHVQRGGRYITPELADMALGGDLDPSRAPHESLTDRQLEILILLGQGRSPSEIASATAIRATTVSTHLQQIKRRLGLRTNQELVLYAVRCGLVSG